MKKIVTLAAALFCSVTMLTSAQEAEPAPEILQGYTLLADALMHFNGNEKTEPNWKKAEQKLKAILKISSKDVELKSLKTHARALLGTIFFTGLFGAKQNWKHAVACLSKVAEQNEFPAQRAEAYLKLGIIYLIGNNDVAKDEEKAENHLVFVTQQTDYPDMQAIAYTRLALKYAFIDEDFEQAATFCAKAKALSQDEAIQKEVALILEQIEELKTASAQEAEENE